MKVLCVFLSGLFCLFCSTAHANKIESPDHTDNIICHKEDSPDEMVFVRSCQYKDMGLLQAYTLYLSKILQDDQKDFIKNPQPGQNKHINDLGNAMSVEYKWQGVNELNIDQLYAGGETKITFKYDGKDTAVITTLYPD